MRSWRTESVEETRRVGALLAAELAPDGVLLLTGDLGAGKTAMTAGVAGGLGIDPDEIQSPTFVLVREHEGPTGRLFHVDLYRLDADQAAAAGIEEILAEPGVKVVEWPDRLPYEPPGAMRIEIERAGETARTIREIL